VESLAAESFDLKTRVETLNRTKTIAMEILDLTQPNMDAEKKAMIAEIVATDTVGFGPIEYLWIHDRENLEEIEVDHPMREIMVYHRKHGRCITNIRFVNERAFRRVMNAIIRPLGKQLDPVHPVVDAQLPDGSRLHAQVYPASLTGATANIRLLGTDPWTFVKMIKFGSATAEMGAYLWMVVEQKKVQMVITGPPASGKTSFLSSLLVFIPRGERVVSVEEEINELRFYDKFINWIPLVGVYKEKKEEALKRGMEVGMLRTSLDQITNALRMRPDRLVVGEMRGEEAIELFSGANLGIPFMTTLHSQESGASIIKRLANPPMSVPVNTISMLDLMVALGMDAENKRRVTQFSEILWRTRGDLPSNVDNAIRNKSLGGEMQEHVWRDGNEAAYLSPLFEYDPKSKEFDQTKAKSVILQRYAKTFGMTDKQVDDELERRAEILQFLSDNSIVSYYDVGRIVYEYYNAPLEQRDKFLDRLKSELKAMQAQAAAAQAEAKKA